MLFVDTEDSKTRSQNYPRAISSVFLSTTKIGVASNGGLHSLIGSHVVGDPNLALQSLGYWNSNTEKSVGVTVYRKVCSKCAV